MSPERDDIFLHRRFKVGRTHSGSVSLPLPAKNHLSRQPDSTLVHCRMGASRPDQSRSAKPDSDKYISKSHHSWVCFDCRLAIRRPKDTPVGPRCSACGADCVCIGYKIEIPRKVDVKGWKKLKERLRNSALEAMDRARVGRVRAQHGKEQRIKTLKALDPPGPETRGLIAKLEKKVGAELKTRG